MPWDYLSPDTIKILIYYIYSLAIHLCLITDNFAMIMQKVTVYMVYLSDAVPVNFDWYEQYFYLRFSAGVYLT